MIRRYVLVYLYNPGRSHNIYAAYIVNLRGGSPIHLFYISTQIDVHVRVLKGCGPEV